MDPQYLIKVMTNLGFVTFMLALFIVLMILIYQSCCKKDKSEGMESQSMLPPVYYVVSQTRGTDITSENISRDPAEETLKNTPQGKPSFEYRIQTTVKQMFQNLLKCNRSAPILSNVEEEKQFNYP